MTVLILEKIGIITVMRFHGEREDFLEFAQEKARDGYSVEIPFSSWSKNKPLRKNKIRRIYNESKKGDQNRNYYGGQDFGRKKLAFSRRR